MAAVTVSEQTVLPTITTINLTTSQERTIVSITTAPSGFEGEGFPVRRAFSGVPQRMLDPFIMMDQMGEVEYAPGEPKGTPWHPHRGFETVTYLIDGTFEHEDSQGGGGLISNGDTQWMTAGSGLLHIERPPEELVARGGLFHGSQLWVNLPAKKKMIEPRYQSLAADHLVLLRSPDGGSFLRLIAGDFDGHCGPGSTHSPITYIHATLSPGARLELPWKRAHNALVYVLAGSGTVGPEQAKIGRGQLAVFSSGDHFAVQANATQEANTPSLELLILGGEPIGETVAWYGPFVMNTEAELRQAVEDFQSGKMGEIPANT